MATGLHVGDAAMAPDTRADAANSELPPSGLADESGRRELSGVWGCQRRVWDSASWPVCAGFPVVLSRSRLVLQRCPRPPGRGALRRARWSHSTRRPAPLWGEVFLHSVFSFSTPVAREEGCSPPDWKLGAPCLAGAPALPALTWTLRQGPWESPEPPTSYATQHGGFSSCLSLAGGEEWGDTWDAHLHPRLCSVSPLSKQFTRTQSQLFTGYFHFILKPREIDTILPIVQARELRLK